MRSIGAAEPALELMCERAADRVAFGRPLAERANVQDWIAESRIEPGDFPLAEMYAQQRSLRLADGPDEVHRRTIFQEETRR